MLNNILNLEGVNVLSREQKKSIFGGNENELVAIGETSCKATCNNGTVVGTSSCDNKELACSQEGGAKSCKCP